MADTEKGTGAPLLSSEKAVMLHLESTSIENGKQAVVVSKNLDVTHVPRRRHKKHLCSSAMTRQITAAIFASLSSVTIGFITAYSSLTLPLMKNDTSINFVEERDAEWIASIPSVSSIGGALLGGFLMDIYGPRWTLVLTSIPCVISWGLIAFAHSMAYIYLGRIITGVFLGIFSPVPQVYATEIAEPKIRGLMGAFPEAAVALGSLLCYAFGSTMRWRSLAVAAAVLPGFPLFVGMFYLPESPQWLTKKDKMIKAEKSMQFFRDTQEEVEEEIKRIHDNIKETEGEDISIIQQIRLLKKPQNWQPVLIVFLVFMCGQCSGFAVVTAYTGFIFNMANTGIDTDTSTIIVGIIRFLATIVSAFLLDTTGRKPLLIISAIGSSVGMVSLGIFFYMQTFSDVEHFSWLPLASLVLYVFFNELGYGPVPWLLSGELIPLAVRSIGNGIAVTAYSLFAFIVGLTFPMLNRNLSNYVTFWLYGLFSLSGVVLGVLLPETKGKTLEDIEKFFKPKPKRTIKKPI